MIGIKSKKTLARVLGLPTLELASLSQEPEQFVRHYTLLDPAKPGQHREVISVRGKLRLCQRRLLGRLFSKFFKPGECSHGGVRRRNIKTNAKRHLTSAWIFTTDVSQFFPSIHRRQVYRFLVTKEGCSPEVARLITRLCTYDHHLAPGLVTSPMLADQLFRPVDQRLSAVARSSGLIYTRFVDDISFSGSFDFERSGIPGLVVGILREHGYSVRAEKHRMGRADDPSMAVTQLRLKQGHLDVRREYVDKLSERMSQLLALSHGDVYAGEYLTRDQLEGRVRFVCWVNPGRGGPLWRQFRQLDWKAIEREALQRHLVVERVALVRQPREDGKRDIRVQSN
jgi:RNA-directed DNA polymerase